MITFDYYDPMYIYVVELTCISYPVKDYFMMVYFSFFFFINVYTTKGIGEMASKAVSTDGGHISPMLLTKNTGRCQPLFIMIF